MVDWVGSVALGALGAQEGLGAHQGPWEGHLVEVLVCPGQRLLVLQWAGSTGAVSAVLHQRVGYMSSLM